MPTKSPLPMLGKKAAAPETRRSGESVVTVYVHKARWSRRYIPRIGDDKGLVCATL